MADNENQKEIIVSIKTDASGAGEGISQVKTQLNELNNTSVDQPFKSLRQQIREALTDAQHMAEQFGRNSQQFVDATVKVAGLKKEFREINETIAGFSPDNKLASLSQVAKGAAGTINGIGGAFVAMGVESSKATETLARLQGLLAFSEALKNVDDIKNGFENFGLVIKNVVVNAFTSLRGAVLATGIGTLLVAIGYAITNFDKLKESLGFATKAQEDLNKSQEDFQKETAKSITKVEEVKEAFKLAEEGVISKKQALDTYNDKLGDVLGHTKSLNEAEQLTTSKAEAFIQVTGLKAQAMALFAKAADYSSKALTAQNEDQTSFFAKLSAGFDLWRGKVGDASKTLLDSQKEGLKEVQDEAAKNQKTLNDAADGLLHQAALIASGATLHINVVDDTKTKDVQPTKDAFKEREKALAEHLKAMQEQIAQSQKELDEVGVSARQKELIDNDFEFAERKKKLLEVQQEEIKLIEDEYKAKKITTDVYEKRRAEDKKTFDDQYLVLEELNGSKRNAINKKYADEINKTVEEYLNKNVNEYDVKAKKINEVFDAMLKNATDKQKFFLTLVRTSLLNDNDNLKDLSDKSYTAQTNVIKTETIDRQVKTDTPAQAKAKVDAIFKAQVAAENANFELQKQQKEGNNLELQRIEAEHQKRLVDITDNASKERKAIDEAEKEAKINNLNLINSVLDAASLFADQKSAAGKTIAVAETTINTYLAAQKAYASQIIPGDPSSIFRAYVAEGSAILVGIANVKKILAVKAGNSGTSGTAPSPSITTAPSINAQQLQQQLNIQDVRVVNQNQQPIKAYITSKDLQTQEEKSAFLNRISTF